jgi:hypothetical protein
VKIAPIKLDLVKSYFNEHASQRWRRSFDEMLCNATQFGYDPSSSSPSPSSSNQQQEESSSRNHHHHHHRFSSSKKTLLPSFILQQLVDADIIEPSPPSEPAVP